MTALFALLLSAHASQQPMQASASDCVEIGVHSTGFHTGVVIPGHVIEPDHPLHRLFPEARWIAVGWGDEDFYREPGGGTSLQGLRAAFPGGSTVLQVIGLPVEPERYFASQTVLRTTTTREDAAGLLRFINEEIARAPDGDAIVVGPAHRPGQSYFIRGLEGRFHLFNNCNHWTVRALRTAGVPIGGALTADSVTRNLRDFTRSCSAPAAESGPGARAIGVGARAG